MNDYRGKPKTYGGDFILARIHSPELKAGAAGVPEDFNNGTYRVNFTLFWPGSVKVSVLLMHSSEVLSTLWQAKEYCNDKFIFTGTFRNSTLEETSICDIHLSTNEPVCEFKDERNQESFSCFKPKTLPCETLHYTRSRNIEASCLTQAEKQLLKRSKAGVTIQNEFRDITVVTRKDRVPQAAGKWIFPFRQVEFFLLQNEKLPKCERHEPVPSGETDLKYTSKTEPKAPKLAIDKRRNITISWKMHGFPCISFSPCFISGGIYIVQELDRLAGGENTVVVISVGLHIRPFPLKFYITRMVTIKQAVTRLLQRSPLTRVFVKSENTRELNSEKIRMSNWHGHLQNLALREVFSGVKVGFIDAWDMTLAANTFEFHPNRNIVHNQIALFLSYLCGPNS
ncbi:NXPE family member 1 [Acipenser ruthenus]|uniref:NXPE family member 1 n=1 Tax=Acipenser ruthenus TaxID=7906 RepID=A0A444UG96_ACIRT|nr:NXPE family member 1 [Acipenser ruthenus]